MLHVWDDDGNWTPEAIVRLRQRLGWSQETLARRIGRSTSAVSKWEIGASSPNFDARRALDMLATTSYARLA